MPYHPCVLARWQVRVHTHTTWSALAKASSLSPWPPAFCSFCFLHISRGARQRAARGNRTRKRSQYKTAGPTHPDIERYKARAAQGIAPQLGIGWRRTPGGPTTEALKDSPAITKTTRTETQTQQNTTKETKRQKYTHQQNGKTEKTKTTHVALRTPHPTHDAQKWTRTGCMRLVGARTHPQCPLTHALVYKCTYNII